MTISSRVIILSTCAMSTIMAFGGFSLVKMKDLASLTEKLYQHPYKVGVSLRDFESQVLEMNKNYYDLRRLTGNHSPAVAQQKIESINAYHQKNSESLKIVETNFLGNKEKLYEVKESYVNWHKKISQISQFYVLNNIASATSLGELENSAAKHLDDLYTKSMYLKEFADTKASTFYSNAKSTAHYILLGSALFLGLGFVFLGTISFILIRSLNQRLRSVAEQLAFNTKSVADEAADITISSSGLSSTVSQQASSLHETAASVDELTAMVKNNVRQAEQSKNLAESMKTISTQIGDEMGELTASMKEIVESNEKIEELVTVIDKIGEKTRVIDEIAFQTKILSLNASVEAERAGEHGRGFSVVAQEVSNLAQMSGQASKEISEIVKSSVNVARDISSKNEKKVRYGESLVTKTAKAIAQITQNLVDIFQSSDHILTASRDQSDGIMQVNQAMSELNDVTQQNSNLAEQSALAAKNLQRQVLQLRKITSDIASLLGTTSSENSFDERIQPPEELENRFSESRQKKVVPLKTKPSLSRNRVLADTDLNIEDDTPDEDGWKAI